MAQINLNDVFTPDSETQNNQTQVGFFNLQNDGEEAVVRFLIDSIDDMEILTVHDINVNGKFRQISCVRDPREDISKCPLCQQDAKVKQVVFIKMLQYVNTPDGIEVKPVVWQRNASTYAFKMKGFLDNYGPMSNVLCKVIRHGARGDMKTTYDIIPNLNPQQFPQEQYPIVTEAFNNYKALGRVVLDKSVEDINAFIQTGTFPEVQQTQSQVTPQPTQQQTVQYTPVEQTQTQIQTFPGIDTSTAVSMERPVRYY